MREVKFIKQNAQKWKEFEQLIKQNKETDADKLAELYIHLSDDLAWAQTFYPNSKTTVYLNNLTARVHQDIYKNKEKESGRIARFWKIELPMLYFKHRKKLLASFLLFVAALFIGIISAANDPMFTRMIMGDRYVNITINNIQNNDPMAVYKAEHGLNMFFGITFNNIRVSFLAFISGLLASLGTAFMLLYNGIMIGSFLSFFANYNLVGTSLSVVFIHGTLELSAIIIAGGAGFVMGNSLLFPGSFTRLSSFKKGAREGLKMTMGLIPIFIAAGFLESFITRYTNMPLILSLLIIGSSAAFILWYFVYYPHQLSNRPNKYGIF